MQLPRPIADPSDDDVYKAIRAYEEFLKHLGIWDIMGDEPKKRTPTRVAYTFLEFFGNTLEPLNFTVFPVSSKHNRLVITKDIQFAALCSHHHLPFIGRCHIGYLPNEVVAGLSKIARVVEHFTHGAVIQEDVTEDIAEFLQARLDAAGTVVLMEGEHSCMSLRGVRKPGHQIITLATRGVYCQASYSHELDRFLNLVRKGD